MEMLHNDPKVGVCWDNIIIRRSCQQGLVSVPSKLSPSVSKLRLAAQVGILDPRMGAELVMLREIWRQLG